MSKVYGVSDENFQAKSSLPFMYISLVPYALITTVYDMHFKEVRESDMQGDILTKTKNTYEKVMRIVRFLNRKWVYVMGLLILSAMLFAAIFNINSMAMAPTEQGYNLHILATKLNVVLYILAFLTGAASMWKTGEVRAHETRTLSMSSVWWNL